MSGVEKSMCNCGTLAEAQAVAEKMIVDMLTTDCPVWTFQVATAMTLIATTKMMEEFGGNKSLVARAQIDIMLSVQPRIDMAAIMKRVDEKKAVLYAN